MSIKFGYTIVYVENVEKALSFFENAFGLVRRFLTKEKDYGELMTGDTTLAFASHELGSTNFSSGYLKVDQEKQLVGMEIALVVEDVALVYENAIKHGAVEIKAPENKPWGQVVSYVRSPSGILLELCTAIKN